MFCTGKVKFFSPSKGIGFVKPSSELALELKEAYHLNGTPSKVRIFLLEGCFSGPLEKVPGKLELCPVNAKLPYELPFATPINGDELVVRIKRNKRGLLAVNWTFADLWRQASSQIARRLKPDLLEIKVTQLPQTGGAPIIIFEGPSDLYFQKLNNGFREIRQRQVMVESLRIHGWHPEPHPSIWHPNYMTKEVS